MSQLFLEVEFGRPRSASYDPAVPIYERRTLRVDGVNCAARREARKILAACDRVGDRMVPRMRGKHPIRVRRTLLQAAPMFKGPQPLYEA